MLPVPFLIKMTHFLSKIVQYRTKLALMDSKTKTIHLQLQFVFSHPLLIINILYKYFVSRVTFKRQPNYSNGYLIPTPNEKQKLHLISFRYTPIRMDTSMLAFPFQWVALPTLLHTNISWGRSNPEQVAQLSPNIYFDLCHFQNLSISLSKFQLKMSAFIIMRHCLFDEYQN